MGVGLVDWFGVEVSFLMSVIPMRGKHSRSNANGVWTFSIFFFFLVLYVFFSWLLVDSVFPDPALLPPTNGSCSTTRSQR